MPVTIQRPSCSASVMVIARSETEPSNIRTDA